MSSTDYLRITEHKIFKEAAAVLPKEVDKPLNLLAVRDSVLFTWDFSNNCVLSLNIKAARGKRGDEVAHQKLLPLHPPLFTPEFLFANETGNLLGVAGSDGILVMQLPPRCPPHGAFDGNKELVYCRTHSLDERLLVCCNHVQVRRAKFHPGSVSDSHVLVLTSDNMLRLYQIQNNEALNVGAYPIGEKPGGLFPGTTLTFLDVYGESAVDFDFGMPEIADESTHRPSAKPKKEVLVPNTTHKFSPKVLQKPQETKPPNQHEDLTWPIYVLRGDGSIFWVLIDLNKRVLPVIKGPCIYSNPPELADDEACSIICLKTTPQIISVASSTGLLTHSVLLTPPTPLDPLAPKPNKQLLVFETVELELGLTVSEDDGTRYKCPVFLHRDESKVSRYFATHGAGVHTLNINCVEELHDFVFGPDEEDPSLDIFSNQTSAEYLVCTKTSNTTTTNPIVGFSLYYEPTSLIAMLSDGSVVTMGIMSAALPPKTEDILLDQVAVQSPLKKMLNEPFDLFIQKILKKGVSRPLLKLSSSSTAGPKECYEILRLTAETFREEHFKNFTKASEELEKRAHTLSLLKKAQKIDLDQLNSSKEELRLKAEHLAEKYEDIKDKQDELLKRCEKLLMLVARKKPEPSDAEKKFIDDLQGYSKKCVLFQRAIDTVKKKNKYQEVQIRSWKERENRKIPVIGELQATTIENSLKASTQKINKMVQQVREYKTLLNLK